MASLFIDRNTAEYVDSFGTEHNSQELLNKSISHNVFRIQYNVSIKCGFYFIAFIEYMIA